MQGGEMLRAFSQESYQREITRVGERVYHFLGYGTSNAIAIVGETSVILIDTLDSDRRGEALRKELAGITPKPVKTIVFTHSHPDHTGGAGAFADTVEEIIAFLPSGTPLPGYEKLGAVLGRRGRFQFGYGLTDQEAVSQGLGIREGKEMGEGQYAPLPPTTCYREEEVCRVIDGVPLRLVRAVGESDDQIFIWLEEEKILCTGDNYYGCWPNLYAIRGTQYRDIAAWVGTLGTFLTYPAVALLPGHSRPLLGAEEIQRVIGGYRDAIAFVLEETLACMNRGLSVSETVEAVRLPPQYRALPFLGEYYGTVEWSVRGIYAGYVGWFDGNATNLLPVSDSAYAGELLGLIEGPEKVEEAVRWHLGMGEYQMALQLLELLRLGGVESGVLTGLKRAALLGRAEEVTSANARHYYIASAKELE